MHSCLKALSQATNIAPHVQELILVDDVISVMMGFEGRFIRVYQPPGTEDVKFVVDPSIGEIV